jgi:hypothetical protein
MPLRRRRPLLRAAAVGGGAYAMGKRHAEQSVQEAPTQAPAASPPQGGGQGLSSADMERLQQLARLHEEGVLTNEELAAQKARILG